LSLRVRVARPASPESSRYAGQIGLVVGDWMSRLASGTARGYLVEFADGEIIRVVLPEVEELDES
jgi:hypothetical protein